MLNTDMAEQQLAQVRQTGDRLRSAVRAMVETFPPSARNISGMARFLSLHKATCQRVVEGLEHAEDSVEAFARLPGIRGLLTLTEAAARKNIDPARVEAVRSAIEDYERLLATHGRTQAGLIKLIDTLRSEVQSPVVVVKRGQRDRARERRKALFDAARAVTGEEIGVKSVVAFIRPTEGAPNRMTSTFAVVLEGARRHAFSRPIVPFILGGWWAEHADGSMARPEGLPAEVPPHALLEGFSTTGLKPVRLHDGDGRTLLVVDLQPSERGPTDPRDPLALGPADVAILFRTTAAPNPMVDPRHRLSVGARVTNPCRALLVDAFVHRGIGAIIPDRADAYSLAAPPGDMEEGAPERCWHERFPDSIPIERIGPGASGSEPLYSRQLELIRHIAELDGLDLAAFEHVRAQTTYPLWQSVYRIDFGRGKASGRS